MLPIALLRTDREPPDRAPRPSRHATTSEAIETLRPLFFLAGDLAMDDRAGWLGLCQRAWRDLGDLVDRGVLPRHYELRYGDPPRVVANVVAQAWWYATSPPGYQHHRG